MHREAYAAAVRRRDHLLKVCGAERDRLLADDELSGLHGLDADGLVLVVRDRDGHGVDRVVCEQRLERGICLDAVCFGGGVALGQDVVHAGKLHNARDLLQALRVPAAHAAVTDDGDSYNFGHNRDTPL